VRPPSRASGASAAHAQSDLCSRFSCPCSIFDESGERDYGPGRWKATAEAIAAKIFWDGFFWERFAFISAKGLGCGNSSMVRFTAL
jgi:hypothetical protein